MQQRRPRLGDVLDDYCPRERRVTNHVVVAMIEDQVKQTRCTTCDGDHDYKQARTPSPRKTKAVAAIQDGAEAFEAKPVLAAPARGSADASADSPPDDASMAADSAPAAEAHAPAAAASSPPSAAAETPLALAASAEPSEGDHADDGPLEPGEDEGPVHRRLIRATLPRPEGHVPERKEPEFTIRQQGARGGGGGGREVDGNQRRLPAQGRRRPAPPGRRIRPAAAAGTRGSAASARVRETAAAAGRRGPAQDGQRGGADGRPTAWAIHAASAGPDQRRPAPRRTLARSRPSPILNST